MTEKKQAPAAVIRRTEVAEETAQERLMKKHVPAWVISGAVHVGLIAVLILAFPPKGLVAKGPEKVIDTTAEKTEPEPEKDLTNEDPGIVSELAAADPEKMREDVKTVQAEETKDNLGQPDAPNTDITALAPPGAISNEYANPGAPGDSGDVKAGLGGMNGNIFASFAGRSGATKDKLLAAGGGNKESELAVARGLAWIAKQQKPDGSWEFDGTSKGEKVAATGMCLLPFLAAGETHKSAKKYQKTVTNGLAYLTRNCPLSGPNRGMMDGNMYSQGIASTALAEAYGMTKDKGLLQFAQAAIDCIQKAQGPNGSWGYSAKNPNNGDTSIVGWQIQALKAAQLGKDIVVDAGVIRKAIGFLNLAGADPDGKDPQSSRKSAYGYQDATRARPGTSLTAVGLLCRYYIDNWTPDNAGMQAGVLGLTKRGPGQPGKGGLLDMYYYYYATQVVHFFDGDEWKEWNEGKLVGGKRQGGMRDWLISLQVTKEGANFGSWEPDAGTVGSHCGRLGTTALCVLTLEVYYRHLPLYKRAGQGDEAIKILDGAK
ncbi:MAG: hypothetical protein C0501_09490 [Isosphaera sp.]|nr:hypothetical protein [Isosphaera sp.]